MGRFLHLISVPVGLLVVSVLLGFCAWNIPAASLLIFIAIIPFLVGLKLLSNNSTKKIIVYSLYILVFKFFWVFGQVFWLKDVTYDTFFAAVIMHTLCFFVIQIPAIYSFSRRSDTLPYYLFISGWILFEFFRQNFSLLSPFYILGVMLGEYPSVIQNYSLLGIEGGTIWILLVNFFLFKLIWAAFRRTAERKMFYTTVVIVLIPLLLSFVAHLGKSDSSKTIKVAALHTDFDPVNSYYGKHPEVIIDSLWNLSSGVDTKTQVLLWPETVVTNLGWMQELFHNPNVDSLQQKMKKYPDLNLTFGANIYTLPTDKTDQRLNYNKEYDFYFYVHNVAFTLRSDAHVNFRSKEIFVPFQEEVPYVRTFPSFKKLITVVGNPNFYSTYERDMDVHYTSKGASYTPLLCYEICYPLFTSKVSQDVNFIAVLGNEHWNSSIRGSNIYYNILTAIAVQNAAPIVKSSNNGISVIFDGNGRVIDKKMFHDTGLLTGKITLKEKNSVYSYISGYSYVLALMALLYFFFIKKGYRSNA